MRGHRLALLGVLCGFGALAAIGCSTLPNDAAQTVYATEGSYAAALTVAVEYRKLPACSAASGPLCHDPATVAKMVAANSQVVSAMAEAQTLVRADQPNAAKSAAAIAAVNQALTLFESLTSSVKVK